VRGLLVFATILIATVVVVELVLGLMMGGFARDRNQTQASRPGPVRRAIDVDQFPAPRLQQSPAAELARMKQEEQRRMNAYGWVDPKAEIAHIPVDRAMDILARTGLPKVPAPAAVEGTPPGVHVPPASKRPEPPDESKQDRRP
jgi:hypothetical protein